MKKIYKLLILSVSAGAGHVRAAEALKKTAEKNYPGRIEAVHLDLMDYVPGLFRKIYADSYIKVINNNPELWGFLYNRTDVVQEKKSVLDKIRTAVQRLNTQCFFKELEKIRPDSIICTHFLPAELLSRMIGKNEFQNSCWVAVTDFDIHSLWIHPHMSGYFAASSEVAWRMKDKGIPTENIHVTGIPIMPVFSNRLSREDCAREIGVNHKKLTILLMSGGLGVGGIELVAERLLHIGGDFQILALAGKNRKLLDCLQNIAGNFPGRLFPAGFTTTIEKYMAASDLAISKPGGLTSSECLAMGLPMITISPIPGQEERNADYLLENGAALKAHDVATLEFKLKKLIDNPPKLCEMRNAALQISHPGAASEILEMVVNQKIKI